MYKSFLSSFCKKKNQVYYFISTCNCISFSTVAVCNGAVQTVDALSTHSSSSRRRRWFSCNVTAMQRKWTSQETRKALEHGPSRTISKTSCWSAASSYNLKVSDDNIIITIGWRRVRRAEGCPARAPSRRSSRRLTRPSPSASACAVAAAAAEVPLHDMIYKLLSSK